MIVYCLSSYCFPTSTGSSDGYFHDGRFQCSSWNLCGDKSDVQDPSKTGLNSPVGLLLTTGRSKAALAASISILYCRFLLFVFIY